MSDLDEAERALLALASDAHDPTDADRARVRAALAARLGAAAGLGVGAAIGAAATAKAATAGATGVATTVKAMAAGASGLGSTGTASAVVTGGALATKLVVAVAITATVGVGATVRLVRHASHGPAPAAKSEVHNRRTAMAAPHAMQAMRQPQDDAPAVEAPVAEPAPAPDRPAVAPARTTTAAPARATASQVPAPVAAPAPSVRVAEVPAPIAPPVPLATAPEAPRPAARIEAPPATVSNHRSPPATVSRGQACGPAGADLEPRRPGFTVADETRLVHDGVRALHEGQPACALSLLDTHAHFYPHGILAEERDAERALALADLGRIAEARGVAAAFLRAHPTSPLGVRLRQRIPGLDAIDHDMTGGAARP